MSRTALGIPPRSFFEAMSQAEQKEAMAWLASHFTDEELASRWRINKLELRNIRQSLGVTKGARGKGVQLDGKPYEAPDIPPFRTVRDNGAQRADGIGAMEQARSDEPDSLMTDSIITNDLGDGLVQFKASGSISIRALAERINDIQSALMALGGDDIVIRYEFETLTTVTS